MKNYELKPKKMLIFYKIINLYKKIPTNGYFYSDLFC